MFKKLCEELKVVIKRHESVEFLNLTSYKTILDYGLFEDTT